MDKVIQGLYIAGTTTGAPAYSQPVALGSEYLLAVAVPIKSLGSAAAPPAPPGWLLAGTPPG